MDFGFVDKITEKYIAKGYFPSAVISIYDGSGTLYRKAYGDNPAAAGDEDKAMRSENGRVPVNTDTVYDMASCTKIATSTQILLLIDEGRLSLDTKVPDVLTEIKSRPHLYERLKDATIYQLLTHSSGILDWYPFYTQRGRDFYDVFESFIGKTEVMKGVKYSDMSFMMLGKILEKIKGKPLKECQDDLKALLGAKHMEFLPEDVSNMAPSCYGNSIEERMVADRGLSFDGFRSKEKPLKESNDGNSYYFFGSCAGHAGIAADADAYERLGRLYLNADSALLKDSMQEKIEERGLGWEVYPTLYPHGCGHTGFTGTCIYVCDEKKFGVISLTNRLCYPEEHGTNTSEFRRELNQAVYKYLAE